MTRREGTEDALTVSVVMPVKDRFDLAALAMMAVLNQTSPIQELIVVDDASSTPAENHFGDIVRRAAGNGIQVRFLRNDPNRGVSASRNRGFHASIGEIVCFCDSDDFWLPLKVAHARDVFSGSDVDVYFHAFVWGHGTLRTFSLLPRGRLVVLPRPMLVLFGFLCPSCLSLRRTAFGAGFDETMRYHEDLDFVLHRSLDGPIHFFNSPLTMMARPPGSPGGATQNEQAMRLGAITALRRVRGSKGIRLMAAAKIKFHQLRLFALRRGSTP